MSEAVPRRNGLDFMDCCLFNHREPPYIFVFSVVQKLLIIFLVIRLQQQRFFHQGKKARVVSDIGEVLVELHMRVVGIAEVDRLVEALDGGVLVFVQGVAAGEVILDCRVPGIEGCEDFVDFQAVRVKAKFRKTGGDGGQGFYLLRTFFKDPAAEFQAELHIVPVSRRQRA